VSNDAEVEAVARAISRVIYWLTIEGVEFFDASEECREESTDAARAAIAALDGVRGWRPIETAPKGCRILGFVDGEVRFIQWGKTSHVPIWGWNLADQGAEEFDLCKPTHWMPLPTAPEDAP